MKKSLTLILTLLILNAHANAQQSKPPQPQNPPQFREYSFLAIDAPARLYTMRQYNENFLSTYRLASIAFCNSLPDTMHIGKKRLAPMQVTMLAQMLPFFLLYPLTHEEGHRAVLTAERIGSVSAPFWDFQRGMGVAYVNGVRDTELKNLRDTKLPTYIRLHIAGNESDYAQILHSANMIAWERENMYILSFSFLMRKLSIIQYYLIKFDVKDTEDELKRDIVGNDVLSAIRHLHRPAMEFTRYTNFDDFTDEEKKFHKRVQYKSLINLIDPFLLLKRNFKLKNGLRFNFAGGYGMTPFGDFIDEQFWLKTQKLNVNFYFREYQNRNTWFPAAGVTFAYLEPVKWFIADVTLHGWQQPKSLDFNTSQGQWGGAVDAMFRFRIHSSKHENTALSLNFGIVAKTQGYLLEEMALDKHIGLRFGASLWLK